MLGVTSHYVAYDEYYYEHYELHDSRQTDKRYFCLKREKVFE